MGTDTQEYIERYIHHLKLTSCLCDHYSHPELGLVQHDRNRRIYATLLRRLANLNSSCPNPVDLKWGDADYHNERDRLTRHFLFHEEKYCKNLSSLIFELRFPFRLLMHTFRESQPNPPEQIKQEEAISFYGSGMPLILQANCDRCDETLGVLNIPERKQ